MHQFGTTVHPSRNQMATQNLECEQQFRPLRKKNFYENNESQDLVCLPRILCSRHEILLRSINRCNKMMDRALRVNDQKTLKRLNCYIHGLALTCLNTKTDKAQEIPYQNRNWRALNYIDSLQ